MDIVEQHLDELDFLWELREAKVFSRGWTLAHLAEHEERAEAHLDGLRLAELHAVDLAREGLNKGETFLATASTLVLFDADEPQYDELILQTMRSGDPPAVDGIRVALRHCAVSRIQIALQDVMAGADLVPAVAAADILAFHRISGRSLASFLSSDDAWVRRLALGIAGRVGSLPQSNLYAALRDPERAVRSTAWQEAARAGVPDLAKLCRSAATSAADPDPEALYLLGVLGDPEDISLLVSAVRDSRTAPAAVSALGAMGRVQAVPVLLDLMADPVLGIAAAAAYERITAADGFEGEKPPAPPPVLSKEDDRVGDAPDRETEGADEEEDALPPDPAKAAADWKRRQSEMAANVAWQAGAVIPEDRLPPAFDKLPLESRRDVYLRLRARRYAPDLELEGQARRQRMAGDTG